MLQSKTIFFRISTLLVSAALLAATFSLATAAETTASATIAALENGVPIYESELAPLTESRIKKYRQLGSKNTDGVLHQNLQRKALDTLIGNELLSQAGAALKPRDLEEQLAKRLASSQATVHDKTPLTNEQREALTNTLRKEILKDSYLEHKGLNNLTVDEQTLRQFYDNNLNSFRISKTVKASHILIGLPKTPTADQEREARDKAAHILKELKQGKDFALLAIQSSDCNTKINGGDLGFIKQGFMPKEFDAVAFNLKAGETSDIVKTVYGLHIIRVEESKPETISEFSEIKPRIAKFLQKDYQRNKIDELVEVLKKSAKIEVLIK